MRLVCSLQPAYLTRAGYIIMFKNTTLLETAQRREQIAFHVTKRTPPPPITKIPYTL